MTEQHQSLRAIAAKGGRWTAASAIGVTCLQIVQLALLGRLLGPSEFGLMAMMNVVIGLANAIADFGLGNYALQKERFNRKDMVSLLKVITVLAIFFAISVAYLSSAISTYYRIPELSQLLPWLSATILFFAVSQMLMAVLQRFFAYKQISLADISAAIISLLAAVILAYKGYGVWALVIGQIAGGAIRLMLLMLPVFLLYKELPDENEAQLAKAGGFAIYQTGERALQYLGWNIDKLIIGRNLGDIGLGMYSIAYQLMIRPISIINPIFSRVAFPLFVSIRTNNDRLATGYLQLLRTIALLSFPVYIVMAIGAPTIVHFLLGDKWSESIPILCILSLLGMLFSIGNPIGILILAKSKPKWSFIFNLMCLLVYFVAFWIGSYYSAMGVAIAFLLSTVFILYPIEFYLRYLLVRMTVSQYFKSMAHLFIAASIPLLIHWVISVYSEKTGNTLVNILMSTVAVLFFYGYIMIFDRTLIESTKNIILRGK